MGAPGASSSSSTSVFHHPAPTSSSTVFSGSSSSLFRGHDQLAGASPSSSVMSMRMPTGKSNIKGMGKKGKDGMGKPKGPDPSTNMLHLRQQLLQYGYNQNRPQFFEGQHNMAKMSSMKKSASKKAAAISVANKKASAGKAASSSTSSAKKGKGVKTSNDKTTSKTAKGSASSSTTTKKDNNSNNESHSAKKASQSKPKSKTNPGKEANGQASPASESGSAGPAMKRPGRKPDPNSIRAKKRARRAEKENAAKMALLEEEEEEEGNASTMEKETKNLQQEQYEIKDNSGIDSGGDDYPHDDDDDDDEDGDWQQAAENDVEVNEHQPGNVEPAGHRGASGVPALPPGFEAFPSDLQDLITIARLHPIPEGHESEADITPDNNNNNNNINKMTAKTFPKSNKTASASPTSDSAANPISDDDLRKIAQRIYPGVTDFPPAVLADFRKHGVGKHSPKAPAPPESERVVTVEELRAPPEIPPPSSSSLKLKPTSRPISNDFGKLSAGTGGEYVLRPAATTSDAVPGDRPLPQLLQRIQADSPTPLLPGTTIISTASPNAQVASNSNKRRVSSGMFRSKIAMTRYFSPKPVDRTPDEPDLQRSGARRVSSFGSARKPATNIMRFSKVNEPNFNEPHNKSR
ncbi:unnamed protein product [Amoebophrya sp. A25]|nr:unnamed protein product [Amoebophrya sp. A25]|eukprot:GSA25T00027791001.1